MMLLLLSSHYVKKIMCQCHSNSIEIRIRMCFMIKHLKDFISVGTLGIKGFAVSTPKPSVSLPMVSNSLQRLTVKSQKFSKSESYSIHFVIFRLFTGSSK